MKKEDIKACIIDCIDYAEEKGKFSKDIINEMRGFIRQCEYPGDSCIINPCPYKKEDFTVCVGDDGTFHSISGGELDEYGEPVLTLSSIISQIKYNNYE